MALSLYECECVLRRSIAHIRNEKWEHSVKQRPKAKGRTSNRCSKRVISISPNLQYLFVFCIPCPTPFNPKRIIEIGSLPAFGFPIPIFFHIFFVDSFLSSYHYELNISFICAHVSYRSLGK